MKEARMSTPQRDFVLTRIEVIQKELEELRKVLVNVPRKKQVKIGGILKGWKVPDRLIEEAKKSIFKEAYK